MSGKSQFYISPKQATVSNKIAPIQVTGSGRGVAENFLDMWNHIIIFGSVVNVS